jgi:UDP-galactopyranose mutase
MTMTTTHSTSDLVCFSHLRWDFVVQRPQHLMRRFAAVRRVFYVEEPVFEAGASAHLSIRPDDDGVTVVIPVLPDGSGGSGGDERDAVMRSLIEGLLEDYDIQAPTFWYYTPMAMAFTPSLRAEPVIYDCMDELSAFKGASPELLAYERELLARADLVFTGGHSLFESKRGRNPNVHEFASSIDAHHFRRARTCLSEPADLHGIARPRVGYYGVIDERCDLDLLRAIAVARPEYSFVMVGPVVKIDEASLPQLPNLHYLGRKEYADLPSYLAHWDVAMMPFAMNEATRYISPTKTPEFLAAGLPVVSTPVRDVVQPYGSAGFAAIAGTASEFADCIDAALAADHASILPAIDQFLATNSWDSTWARMARLESELSLSPVRDAGTLVS